MTVASHSIWRDLLSTDDAATLDPGVPEHFERRPDVVVVGGGIVGVAAGLACQRAGLGDVVVLEAATLGAGATGGAAGLLVPDAHLGTDPDWFVDLARQSLGLWRDLDGQHGGVGLTDLDWIGLEPDPPRFRRPVSGEVLTAREVADLIPGLADPRGGLLLRHQARLNPLLALARLSTTLEGVATGVTVTSVTTRGSQISELTTSVGTLTPEVVIFATGVPPRLAGLDLDLPGRTVKGHLLVTQQAPFELPVGVEPVATPLEDGRLLVGGTLDIADTSPDVDGEVIAFIQDWLAMALPAAAGLGLTHAWCCFRPAHADHLPVLDRVPGLTNAWVTSGHYRTGILMAPVTGKLLATWISDGATPPEAAPLGIARLASPE